MDEQYKEIYGQISTIITPFLGNYVDDEDKSYQAGMSLLMFSMKMLMFSGVKKDDLPLLCKNIQKTFDTVYEDFKRVDLNLMDEEK